MSGRIAASTLFLQLLFVVRPGRGNNDLFTSAPFAQAQGAATDSFYETADGTAAGWWRLRSPGFFQAFAAYVFSDGTLSYTLVQDGSGTVRPALWVKLDAGIL